MACHLIVDGLLWVKMAVSERDCGRRGGGENAIRRRRSTFKVGRRPIASSAVCASGRARRRLHNSLADFSRSSSMKLNTFHMDRSVNRSRPFRPFYHHVYFVKVACSLIALSIFSWAKGMTIRFHFPSALSWPSASRITLHNRNGDTVAVEPYDKLTPYETVHVHPQGNGLDTFSTDPSAFSTAKGTSGSR